MNLQQFFLILQGRWRLALQVFLGVVVVVVAITFLLPNQYTATASVVADNNKPDPLSNVTSFTDQGTIAYMATQVGIINSTRVIKDVANAMEADPAFDFHQKWQASTQGKTDFMVWFTKRLRKALKVAPTGEGNVIDIAVKWPDARTSAALATAFAQSYINTSIALRVGPAKQYAGWFDEQSRSLRADLEAKQQRVAEFQNEKGIIPTDERLDIESARLSELSTQLVSIQAQRQDSQSRLQIGNTHSDATPEILQSPLIAGLKADLARDEAKQQNLATTLGTSHPEYLRIDAEIESLRSRIAGESQRVIASFGDSARVDQRRESELTAAIDAQKRRLQELKHSRDQAALLQNDVMNAQRNLDAVTQRLEQSNLEGASQQSTVVLLSAAGVPDEPSSPNLQLNAVLAVFFGLVLAAGAVLLRELTDRRVRGPAEMEELLDGVPLMGKLAAIGREHKITAVAPAGLLRLET
jgi:chain length determinant protein EpsF